MTITEFENIKMEKKKNIVLIAHDNKKQEMLIWAKNNRDILKNHNLFATGTTGKTLSEALDLPISRYKSGPLGGDQQIGAAISEGKIDVMIFFWDALEPQPHDVDVKALLRIAALYNIPTACNRSTACFLISSPLINEEYERVVFKK